MSVHKTIHGAHVKALGGRPHRFKISDHGPDQMGDDLPLTGWNFDHYNGRVLWAHDQSIPAIARCPQSPWVQGDGVYADAEFPPLGVYPFSDQIEALVAAGHLGDASVGFRADPGAVRNKHGGYTYHNKTLLEWSIVNTPANPRARLVQPSARGADLATITKWLGETARPVPLMITKGESVRLGAPVPPARGTMWHETRVETGHVDPAVVWREAWRPILAPFRRPDAVDKRGPEVQLDKAAVAKQVRQGVANELGLRRLAEAHEAYNRTREQEQWLRRSW